MLKLQTQVTDEKCKVHISYEDKILMLGSCFTDNVGQKLADYGFDVCINPFGTLYNPVSIARSIARLSSGKHFTEDECVWMGSNAGKVCSFWHHTSFARTSTAEFLDNANRHLDEASEFFAKCSKVIITLGTAWYYRYDGQEAAADSPSPSYRGTVVSNCLKRKAAEFVRERLTVEECTAELLKIADSASSRQMIFTVSPIRHMADGAHGNQLSKSTLLLGVDRMIRSLSHDQDSPAPDYFPAFEIMMDELRDYRFYAEDMVHPSSQTVDYIADRFLGWALPENEKPVLEERIKKFRQSRHVSSYRNI